MPKFALSVVESITESGVSDLDLYLSDLSYANVIPYDSCGDDGGKKLSELLRKFEMGIVRGHFSERLSEAQKLGVFGSLLKGDARDIFYEVCSQEPDDGHAAFVVRNEVGVYEGVEEKNKNDDGVRKVWTIRIFLNSLWRMITAGEKTNRLMFFPQETYQTRISLQEYMKQWENRLDRLPWKYNTPIFDESFVLQAFLDNLVDDLRRIITRRYPKCLEGSWFDMKQHVREAVHLLANEGKIVDLSKTSTRQHRSPEPLRMI